MHNIIIVSAGAAGFASARELSRRRVNACVLEREEDVCCETSKANSAIVYAGHDAPEGSLMAKLNVEGSEIVLALSKELDFPLSRCGLFVVCVDGEQPLNLQAPYERGIANGVRDLGAIMDRARFREMEPSLADEVAGVLYAPTAGVACPFNLNIALAENAYTSGIDSKFNTEVQTTRKIEGGRAIDTNQGVYETRHVVNAAGVHADYFHNMVSETKIHITPRRGDYCLLGKNTGNHVSRTIFALPGKYGKSVLVSPTIHGNLIVGPTTIDIKDKETAATTREGLDEVISKARTNVKDLLTRQVTTSFAGFRAHEDHYEFIVEELKDALGFMDYAGIESPGPTSCPAIGRMVTGMLRDKVGPRPNLGLVGICQEILDPDTLAREGWAELVRKDPTYGNIIYRCKMVTEGEIPDTIHRPLRTRPPDGIERKTKAGMGRC